MKKNKKNKIKKKEAWYIRFRNWVENFVNDCDKGWGSPP